MNLSLFACVLILLISLTNGFYVPGIAPREFTKGSRIGKLLTADVGNRNPILLTFMGCICLVEVKAVKMTSSRTQLPYEYYSLQVITTLTLLNKHPVNNFSFFLFHVQFCLPKNGTLHYKSENLGEVLRGELQVYK